MSDVRFITGAARGMGVDPARAAPTQVGRITSDLGVFETLPDDVEMTVALR